ncbi:hypothetical protein Pcinc_006298 [Petrolisthes cinctipes]|uniref:Uncharacterized protein n=1 Tax=Petrolisthes cinctipes TaxID=88211 RepID=A0AAE1KZA8_PETCI|nr:hypothetical protein Pcinc_006298 [Petrolisthes cinctipes]
MMLPDHNDMEDEATQQLCAGQTFNHNHRSPGSRSRSPSRVTDSTEQSDPFEIDMSNKARLPKGIENIKPHLEIADNVPLLVSLFTDCSLPATRAMLSIMQEYTEVTMVMDSSASADNMLLFMQADARCVN